MDQVKGLDLCFGVLASHLQYSQYCGLKYIVITDTYLVSGTVYRFFFLFAQGVLGICVSEGVKRSLVSLSYKPCIGLVAQLIILCFVPALLNYVALIQSHHKLRLFSCAILQSVCSKCKSKCSIKT